MADPSTKNQYGTKTLVGNYNEDRWGAEISRVKVDETPPTGTSEYASTHSLGAVAGAVRAHAALPAADTIDAYLTFAHGPGTDYIRRVQKPEHFMSMWVAR